MSRFFSRFTIGFAVGYVVGARAGRERYEQLRRWWNSFAGNPTVHQAADKGREFVRTPGGRSSERCGRELAARPLADIRASPSNRSLVADVDDIPASVSRLGAVSAF